MKNCAITLSNNKCLFFLNMYYFKNISRKKKDVSFHYSVSCNYIFTTINFRRNPFHMSAQTLPGPHVRQSRFKPTLEPDHKFIFWKVRL